MEDLIHLISNVGFPIVACFFMAKQQQEVTQSIAKLNETLVSIDRRLEIMEKEVLNE